MFRDDSSQAKELMDAEFSTIVHDGSGVIVIRTLGYSTLPGRSRTTSIFSTLKSRGSSARVL